MKIIISPTSKIVTLKPSALETGVPARVWEGITESGIAVVCFMSRIACDINEIRTEEFHSELQEVNPPSPAIEAISMRLIL
jgi:hypothetical protein